MTSREIGADQVWAAGHDWRPVTGQGITVAVIDSGIDTTHNALKDRVLLTHDFTGGDGVDRYGHGTHVAAIIAGHGGRTPETATYQRHRAGRISPQSARARRRRLGNGEQRDRGDRLGDRPPAAHTTSASSTCRSARRCCSRTATIRYARRSSARRTRGSWSWRRRATSAGRRTGSSVLGGITSPGNSPMAIDRRRDRHARHAGAVGRHRGDVQLKRSDALRPHAEARCRRPRCAHRIGGSGRFVPRQDLSRPSRIGKRSGRGVPTLGHEHGSGRRERRCRADSRWRNAGSARSSDPLANHEQLLAVSRTARRWGRNHRSGCGSGIDRDRSHPDSDDCGSGGGCQRIFHQSEDGASDAFGRSEHWPEQPTARSKSNQPRRVNHVGLLHHVGV